MASAGKYVSQFRVVSSTKDCKNIFTLLSNTSTWALHWGCAGEVFAAVGVYLCRNSKFCEPISVNGVSHHFSILVGNRSDHSVLSECVRDVEDKFFVTVHCDHWAKKICMNPEVWTVQNGKRCQRSPLVC